jgi:aspartate/methionine/tyrosine aminotransferase
MFARRTGWQSAPNRFTAALEARRRAGGELFDLSESNPTRVGLTHPPELLDALCSPSALEYSPDPLGLRSAREAVSAYYRERGVEVSPDRLLLATSTSEAYSWVFRLLCDPGDEVLVPAPSYPLFEYLASIQDVTPVRYPLFYDHGWHVDTHALEHRLAPRSRAVMVVHPNNPTGSYVAASEVAALNRLCVARGMALVADEVFLDFALDGRAQPSLAGNREALTFVLSGLSKIAGLPQMKVAWLVVNGPAELVAGAMSRLEIIADTYLSPNVPVQLATPAFLQAGGSLARRLGERIRANLKTLDDALAQVPAVARLGVEGGWYAVLRVPQTGSDEELAIALLREAGVVVHPGHFYDFGTEGYLVVSLIPVPEVFAAGATRLAAGLARRFA